jgi:PqqD family protein of HPr-rel-A system
MVYTLNTLVSFQRVGDDAVLLHTGSGDYYGLNGSGALIVEQLAAHGDPTVAARQLCDQYDVSPEQAQSDVEQLIGTLLAQGLLEPGA